MQVLISKGEPDKPLKAIYSKLTGNLYFKSAESGSFINYLNKTGERHLSTYRNLESILANALSKDQCTPIYEGDSITITF